MPFDMPDSIQANFESRRISLPIEYSRVNLGTEVGVNFITKQNNLMNGWQHGTGALFNSSCETVLQEYIHDFADSAPLAMEVYEDGDVQEELLNAIQGVDVEDEDARNLFSQRLREAVNQDQRCANAPEAFCFNSLHEDIGVQFNNPLEFDLAIAIGGANFRTNLNVQATPLEGEDSFDLNVSATYELYDFYDFNIGNLTGGILLLNNDGGWVQHGHLIDGREAGRVYVNTIIFTDVSIIDSYIPSLP